MTQPGDVDVVVLTALGLEFDAVRPYLTETVGYFDVGSTRYEIGRLSGSPCRVALAQIGEGNSAAAVLTGRAIEAFAPAALMFVGVAGGIASDVALGDVVVATRINALHSGREERGGFRPRMRGWPLSHFLEQLAREIAHTGAWSERLPGGLPRPKVHLKPVVSGEVVLDSRSSPLGRMLAEHYSDAVAIDMESAGFAEAAHRSDFSRAVTIRGISDLAKGDKRRTDAIGWQPRAAANAAAFAMTLARRIGTRPSRARRVEPRDVPRRLDPAAADQLSISSLVDELAEAVWWQWHAEASLREINRPEPIDLQWSVTERPVAAAGHRPQAGETDSERLPAGGGLEDLVTVLSGLRHRQLVVLGEPGAGKTVTAMMVVLRLLKHRAPGGPVPVLLPMASWDPRSRHLTRWISDRLVEDYGALGNVGRFGPDAALRLVTTRRVWPVLDGLDELPAELHTIAIDELDRAAANALPLMLTCRTQDYEAAVRRGGRVLSTALVVEIDPVRVQDAIRYLTQSTAPGDDRWPALLQHLRTRPQSPLTTALSTPLIVWLTRVVYGRSGTDPSELLPSRGMKDRADVENHLLNSLLPTLYAERPAAPGERPRAQVSADDAKRWLAYLVEGHHTEPGSVIPWWGLARSIPRWSRIALMLGAMAAIAIGYLAVYAALPAMRAGLPLAVSLTAVFVPCIGLTVGLAEPPARPTRLMIQLRSDPMDRLKHLRDGAMIGLIAGVPAAFAGGLPLGAACLIFGALLGTFISLLHPPETLRAVGAYELFRADRAVAFAFTIIGGSVGSTTGFLVAMTTTAVPAWFASTTLGASVGNLIGTLLFPRRGIVRRIAVLSSATLGGLLGFAVGLAVGGRLGGVVPLAVGGFLFGGGYGLVNSLKYTASPWYLLANIYLATRRKTPWALMGFLRDAHHRGVLRQVGTLYEIRHTRLRQLLNADDNQRPW